VTAAPLPAPGNLRRQRWGREQPADLTTREAAEVGNAGSVREDALVIDIVRKPHRCIVTLRGELSLQTAGALATALSKVLVEGRPVLVDLSGFWVGWAPALSVFPATMAAAGGWPHARMVLFDAEPELAGALHRVGVPLAVPLEPTLQAAVQRLGTRPLGCCAGMSLTVMSVRRGGRVPWCAGPALIGALPRVPRRRSWWPASWSPMPSSMPPRRAGCVSSWTRGGCGWACAISVGTGFPAWLHGGSPVPAGTACGLLRPSARGGE